MGTLRRELGRTLGLFSMPMMLGGCSFVFGLAVCQSVCGDEGDDAPEAGLVLEILSPAPNAEFSDEEITVEVGVTGNTDGCTITLGGPGGAVGQQIHLDPGEEVGTMAITPISDTAAIMLAAGAFSDLDPFVLASEARVSVVWHAPWEVTDVQICPPSRSCRLLTATDVLTGVVKLGSVLAFDSTMIDRIEARIDGTLVTNLGVDPTRVEFDVSALPDGDVELALTAVRTGDGATSTVTRTIAVDNTP